MIFWNRRFASFWPVSFSPCAFSIHEIRGGIWTGYLFKYSVFNLIWVCLNESNQLKVYYKEFFCWKKWIDFVQDQNSITKRICCVSIQYTDSFASTLCILYGIHYTYSNHSLMWKIHHSLTEPVLLQTTILHSSSLWRIKNRVLPIFVG